MISVEFGCIIFTTSVPTSAIKSTMDIGFFLELRHDEFEAYSEMSIFCVCSI